MTEFKRRTWYMCLLLWLVLLALAACDTSVPAPADGTAAQTGSSDEQTLELDLTGFVLMRSDTSTKEETEIAVQLRKDISNHCGLDIQLATDWVKRGEEIPTDSAEIIVGNTNRRKDDTLRLAEWSIAREGNRIYIIGGSAEALAEAEAYFAENFLITGGCSMKDGFTERHTVDYPIKSISIGGTELSELKICDISGLSGGKAARLISLLSEKSGMKVTENGSISKADVIVTINEGYGIEKGSWGLSVTDGKLCVIGRTKAEIKKAYAYLISMIEAANGKLEFKNENGKPYIHTEKQMSLEEFYLQKQLVIYPEYPSMINRNYDYAVSVTMDKDTRSIPVYDHTMAIAIKGRALNGDIHRRFSQFAFSGGQVRVDIRVKSSFKSYTIVPSAKGFKNEFKDGVISVYLDKPDYFLVMLDDDLNSILSVFADYPEFPDELPDRDDPDVLWVDGVYKTETGVIDILNKPGFTIYIAPGAVLNCRVKLTGEYTSVIGHGAMVDPFENIYDYNIEEGGTEITGHMFLVVSGGHNLIDGPVLLDARCYNVGAGGASSTIRNLKILSVMMTSDGLATGGNNTLFEHCFIYNGDNSIVVNSMTDCVFSDIMIGTTCSAIFPQSNSANVVMNDIYVFRVGEAVIKATYNPKEVEYTMDFTFNNLDCSDMTFLPYFFQGAKMRSTAKHFTFNNASVILPLGVQDPHTAMSSRAKGTNYFFIFSDSGAQYPTDNFIFDFTNLYVDGKAITAADQLDNNSKAKNNPMTFKSDGSYTPPKKNGQTVNRTAPDRVYAGALQLMFSTDVKKDGTTWLLPADEIKAFLRKPDAKVTTVKKDGADYVKSTDLVSAGMAAKVEEKDGALVITPAYNGENLLLPDKGEISNLQERACYLVDLITQKDADGVYYTARNIKDPTAGIWRLITDEAKMYGAGTYKLTFKARSDAAGKLSAGLRTEISEKSKSFSIGSSWAEYTYEFTVTEAEATGCLALWFAPNVTPYVAQFDIRDISLTKVN